MASSNFDKERSEFSENEARIDRISNLPDHVLCLILSFLETQQSVRTCILSKRWRFLWINVDILAFDCGSEAPLTNNRRSSFEKLVTMAMLLNKSQSLRRFSIKRYGGPSQFLVTASLSTAISRNVSQLWLTFRCSDSNCVAIPSSLFTCKSLVNLTLRGDFLVDFPVLVSLPKLLWLDMGSVKYKCAKTFEKLIEGCPVLASLIVNRTRYDNVGVFRISSPKLQYLVYMTHDMVSRPNKTFPEHIVPKLEINAPALVFLVLDDSVTKDFTFQSLSSSAQGMSGETVNSGENFNSLRTFDVNTRFLKWELLLRLLENLVHLQVLKLEEPSYLLSGSHEMWKNDTAGKLCSSLRRISISKFKETKDVIEMVKYFLQNGEVLEKVKLYPCTEIAVSEKYDLLKKISAIRRKSRACEVHVLD